MQCSFLRLLHTGLLCTGALFVVSCGREARSLDQQPTEAPTAIPVETLILEPGPFDEQFSASGVIEPFEDVTVSAEIAGRIVALRAEIGDEVRRGQLLVQIDDRAQRALVSKITADLERARTQQQWAQRDLDRQIKLFEDEIAAERSRDEAQRLLDTSSNDVTAREADLEAAQVDLSRTRITSPIRGSIAQRHVAPGEYVTPGARLYDVVSTAQVKLVFAVAERDVIGMEVGQQIDVGIDAHSGTPFEGTVRAISPAGSQTTRTFRVEVLLENAVERSLLPGMSGTARVIRERHENVVLIPESAILRDGSGSYVFVAIDDHAQRIDIEIVSQSGISAVVRSMPGLEECIILGQAAVANDGPIRVRRQHTELPRVTFD